jgi:excisionase family DNA binding protein
MSPHPQSIEKPKRRQREVAERALASKQANKKLAVSESKHYGYQPLEPLSVTIETAARVTGYGRSNLLIAVYAEEIRSYKIGKRRLIDFQSLKEWIQKHRVNGPAVEAGEAP